MNPFFEIIKNQNRSVIIGLTNELKAIEIIKEFKKKSVLVVTNSLYEANNFYKILQNYTEDVVLFPMDDFLTSEALAISPELKYKRLETLYSVLEGKKIVVTNLMGYLRFLPPRNVFEESKIHLKINQTYNMKDLQRKLFDLGYEKETIVSKTGEVSYRGFVIDIFSTQYENPVRIEFWGDEIISLRLFDVNSQLTYENLNEIVIYSNTEFLTKKEVPFLEKTQKNLYKYTKTESIYEYIENHKLILINFHDIKVGYQHLVKEMYEYKVSSEIPLEQQFMNDLRIPEKDILYLSDFEDEFSKENILSIKMVELEPFHGKIEDIRIKLNFCLKKKKKVYICVENRYSANKIIETMDSPNIVFTNIETYIPNKINLIIFKMTAGFESDEYIVITEREIFNKKNSNYSFKSKFKLGTKVKDITKLNVGDYIVHRLHGIGRYAGIKSLPKNGLLKDYLMVEYALNDKLYIPVEKIDFIHKYSAKEGVVPKLNKLGSTEWQKTKLRVQKKIENIAEDLLKLYAERENAKGISFDEDTKEQYQFEEEFHYELTEDQKKVIKEIKENMESSTPMDKLLCGDVGFGKTEVAFRAIFKAIMSGYQVAFLCPTTILSNQHFQNAYERFKNYGIEVALLNRFITGNKLKRTIEKIKKGNIDLVIGTHKLLGKEIQFKNLGLLVVDEEQRFGVKHKEKIKSYRNNIDVLTLSATPIPRTLQMSMSGLRSLSLIETPPINRYPVQTYVLAENKEIIKDAIYKELSRNGQVFLLYNYVDSIESKTREIKNLVPSARVIYAHGRMSKTELENVMISFTNHEYDVLICTTIIETGIDIQNVNTLIILDADRFGLSQLYQIRGRVGRTDKIGYAYLMYDKRKILSEIAVKRLKVIKDFTELGSGFAIAMRDLSIRGAGDILGSEQAGFIDSVGIEMFLSMLNEEVAKLKGEKVEDEDNGEMPLIDVATSIKDDYVHDNDLKIEIHKMINEIDSYEKLLEIKDQIEDRFGNISESLLIYMYEEWFEKLAYSLGIKMIKQTKNSIEIILPNELTDKLDGQKLFMEISDLSRMFRFKTSFNRLVIILDIVKLEKHFIYYLIDLMKVIENCKKKTS